MPDRVLIVGASARAAAASARRAGLAPTTIDLFADTDTRQLADEAHRCDPNDYPHGLIRIAAGVEPTPWLYTGGLENHPDVVAAISECHPLLGNGPGVLAKVRNRAWLRAVVAVPGVTMPDALAPDEPTPAARTWLWKPDKGAGGAGVRFSTPGETGGHRERFVDGPVYGATFVTAGGETVLWGVAEQLAGARWLNAEQFAYCGSIGPIDLRPELAATLEAFGSHLASGAGLVGAWNVDFVLGPDGGVVVLELNPRVTAAVDVFDAGPGESLVGAHARACRGEHTARPLGPPSAFGKCVYFAPGRLTFPGPDVLPHGRLADLPDTGEVIESGRPVLTLLSGFGTAGECRADLMSRAAGLDALFRHAEGAGWVRDC